MALVVRDSKESDLPAIAAIYGDAVLHNTGSFEIEPPGIEEMTRRRAAVLADGYPYLVAEMDGKVVGYCYAGTYNKRHGYRFSVENSVYISLDHQNQGIGRALLTELIARCERAGYRLMLAVIGDSGNHSSISLHKAHGFQHAGILPAVGWKFGRWLDVVFMTKPLGEGATTPVASG